MSDAIYIHGTDKTEQDRLATLNRLTNRSFVEFLELRPDSVVFEVGSGLGILAGDVAARLPEGEVVGNARFLRLFLLESSLRLVAVRRLRDVLGALSKSNLLSLHTRSFLQPIEVSR